MKKVILPLLALLMCLVLVACGNEQLESLVDSLQQTEAPTGETTGEPTGEPTGETTGEPTAASTTAPTAEPIAEPTEEPTGEAVSEPQDHATGIDTADHHEVPTEQETGIPYIATRQEATVLMNAVGKVVTSDAGEKPQSVRLFPEFDDLMAQINPTENKDLIFGKLFEIIDSMTAEYNGMSMVVDGEDVTSTMTGFPTEISYAGIENGVIVITVGTGDDMMNFYFTHDDKCIYGVMTDKDGNAASEPMRLDYSAIVDQLIELLPSAGAEAYNELTANIQATFDEIFTAVSNRSFVLDELTEADLVEMPGKPNTFRVTREYFLRAVGSVLTSMDVPAEQVSDTLRGLSMLDSRAFDAYVYFTLSAPQSVSAIGLNVSVDESLLTGTGALTGNQSTIELCVSETGATFDAHICMLDSGVQGNMIVSLTETGLKAEFNAEIEPLFLTAKGDAMIDCAGCSFGFTVVIPEIANLQAQASLTATVGETGLPKVDANVDISFVSKDVNALRNLFADLTDEAVPADDPAYPVDASFKFSFTFDIGKLTVPNADILTANVEVKMPDRVSESEYNSETGEWIVVSYTDIDNENVVSFTWKSGDVGVYTVSVTVASSSRYRDPENAMPNEEFASTVTFRFAIGTAPNFPEIPAAVTTEVDKMKADPAYGTVYDSIENFSSGSVETANEAVYRFIVTEYQEQDNEPIYFDETNPLSLNLYKNGTFGFQMNDEVFYDSNSSWIQNEDVITLTLTTENGDLAMGVILLKGETAEMSATNGSGAEIHYQLSLVYKH